MGIIHFQPDSSSTSNSEHFENETFVALPGRKPYKQVEVKRIGDPENENRQLALCRSTQRREKERAMISKAEERFLAVGATLRQRIKKGQLKSPCI